MVYKIIVDKQSRLNPSNEKREYEIDIEELRCKGDIYDSLIITRDEDYVMRRLSLSEYQVLKVLDEPIREPLENINIELFEGDNYIYLLDIVGNKFYAEYLIKNEFNDLYVTQKELTSAITQTAGQIELSVAQKLDEELTGANIMLKINEDNESEAQINADKININGAISANGNFKINTDGTVGAVGGTVGGWNINSEGLNNGTVFINNDGSSTIYTVADLIIIRGYIMQWAEFDLPPAMIRHYDINNDGIVDAQDYIILQKLIGISMN